MSKDDLKELKDVDSFEKVVMSNPEIKRQYMRIIGIFFMELEIMA